MNLKTKITTGFLALLLLLLALGSYAFYSVHLLETNSRNILKANFYSVQVGHQMLRALDTMAPRPYADTAGTRLFERALAAEAGNVTEPGEQPIVTRMWQAFSKLDHYQTAPSLAPPVTKAALAGELRQLTYQMIDMNTAALTRKNARANQTAVQAGRYVLAFTALSVLIALLFVLSVPEAAVAPLRKLTRSLEHATDQDFNATIPIESDDEFGRVGRAFNQMLVQLNDFRSTTTAGLATERSRARSIVNGLDEGLLLLDENRRIILANPIACDLLGLPAEQLLGRPAAEVARENDLLRAMLLPLDVPRREQAAAEAPLLSITQRGEEAFYRLAVQNLVSFNEASDKMEFVGQILTLRNVSDFKKLDQVKSNFLATVSHELKTPLSSINFSLKLLRNDKIDAAERLRVTDGIARETQRLLRMVGELIDVSRLDSGGGIPLDVQATQVPAVVDYATATVQPQLDDKHLTLHHELPADLPAIRADADKTSWVLINLLANAIRYSPSSQTIGVRAEQVGAFVQVSVRDQGPGIAAEHHEHIFQRFAQVPDQGGYTGGSGLGLNIAREFIAAQGGRLWVDSELGTGSTFCFTLPLAL